MDKPINRSLYSPLGPSQIRLLTLLPGDSQDRTIQCALKHATLQIESARDIQYWRVQETLSRSKTQRTLRRWKSIGQPGYEALSYCWGPNVIYDSIDVNGHQVPVRRGLWTALHYLRYPSGGKKRILWTDAICINQDDLAERSDQVAIMYAIFNRGSEVIVWLGEVYDKSNLAMKAIERSTKDYSVAEAEAEAEVDLRSEADILVERHHAILSFYNRPYWSRLWILQEVCLARKLSLHCGTKSVSWEQFDHFWIHFRRSPGVNPDHPSGPGASYAIPEGLEMLMDMMHRRTCFSNRVFGLLGLVHQPLGGRSLQADYSTGLQQLYIDVMEWYVENENDNLKAEIYGNVVLEMSQVLQGALERPFQRGLETTPSLDVSNMRCEFWMKPDQIIDLVQFVGPSMQVQQSQDGKYLELHTDRDLRPQELIPETSSTMSFDPHESEVLNSAWVVYRQLRSRSIPQHFLTIDSTCRAFISTEGNIYLGGSDVAVGDRIYFVEEDTGQDLWTFKVEEHESRQENESPQRTDAEVTGSVYRWAPSEDTPDSTAFIQQLKMSAQNVTIPKFDKTTHRTLMLSIQDIQRLTDSHNSIIIF
ncbi:HET-domain-containing protein [Mollisia scopiformis]|uniref:HET-domain-containing protein n=1 Tax=Mollisia scopiformis TaxID=149040 RepID=A0A194WX64_MOLSC|nr:HET-domain-containing protein [Mollisia scopiformis]KUJ12573.1 HET-domain-containing protein [Mollisia scopiformis]